MSRQTPTLPGLAGLSLPEFIALLRAGLTNGEIADMLEIEVDRVDRVSRFHRSEAFPGLTPEEIRAHRRTLLRGRYDAAARGEGPVPNIGREKPPMRITLPPKRCIGGCHTAFRPLYPGNRLCRSCTKRNADMADLICA